MSRNERLKQLLAASLTVTNKTPLARRNVLARRLAREAVTRRRFNERAAFFYVAAGTAPRGLWD